MFGRCGVEKPGIGTHLSEDGPVLGEFSMDLVGDQSPGGWQFVSTALQSPRGWDPIQHQPKIERTVQSAPNVRTALFSPCEAEIASEIVTDTEVEFLQLAKQPQQNRFLRWRQLSVAFHSSEGESTTRTSRSMRFADGG